MKPLTKGLIKGGLQTIELFQGLLLGIYVQKMYKYMEYKVDQKINKKTQIEKIIDIIGYVFVLVSSAFIVREFNILFFKKFIRKSMGYVKFIWPPPIMLGFGLLFFQDSLKEKIKTELNFNESEKDKL